MSKFRGEGQFLEPEKIKGAGDIQHVEIFDGDDVESVLNDAQEYAIFRGWELKVVRTWEVKESDCSDDEG